MADNRPRGIRNNNPGNIEWGSPWQGLRPRSEATDARFAQFEAPAWGIRALAVTLITYYDKHKIRTVKQAINRWAPPHENDTGAYARAVAAAVGVDVNQNIDFHDYAILRPMVEAIIRHENGRGPLATPNSWYDAGTMDQGLKLAGVVKPVASALMTKSGAAGAAATAAGGTAAVVEIVNQITPLVQQTQTVASATDGLPSWLRVALIVMTVVAAGAGAYVLWLKQREKAAVQP